MRRHGAGAGSEGGVISAFAGTFECIDDTRRPADERPAPEDYAAWVRQKLASVAIGEPGVLRFRRPRPTAAFSHQDTAHPNYQRVREQARANGFAPIERGTGGRLSIFDAGALAITVVAPHADPHQFMLQRYRVFAEAVASALEGLGIDARIGELANEYCPGKYSINAGGRVKLVGIAQRMNKRAYQMGAIIAVERSEGPLSAIAEAYAGMKLPFDSKTYGAVKDVQPGVEMEDVVEAVKTRVSAVLG